MQLFIQKNYNAKYGTKTLSASEITKTTRNNMVNTARKAKWTGAGSSFVGIGLSYINFNLSDQSWGDYGRLAVSSTSAGLTIFGSTAPIGIGIGLLDIGGGFDWFYNYLDGQEKIYESSGGHVINPGIPGLPPLIKLKK